jgi:hypothetical protein
VVNLHLKIKTTKMKKYALLLSVLFLLFSCKKHKETIAPITEPALSKVFENNILQTEYFYSSSKKVERVNYYDDNGLFVFAFLYSYNTDGNVLLKKQVDIQNKVSYQTIYTWLKKDKISKEEDMPMYGTDSAKITTRKKYEYDLNSRISKRIWTDIQTDKPTDWQECSYYENGDLKSFESYDNPVAPKLKAKYLYSLPAIAAPQNLLKFTTEPIDLSLLTYNTEEQKHFFYDNAGIITSEFTTVRTGTNRNSNGLIISQLQTRKYQKPVKPSVEVKVRYEYIEL